MDPYAAPSQSNEELKLQVRNSIVLLWTASKNHNADNQ